VTRAVRAVGWLLVVAGTVVLLYVVYLLWFTNLGTDRAQREFAEAWDRTVPAQPATPAAEDEDEDDEVEVEVSATPTPRSGSSAMASPSSARRSSTSSRA
jgi:hypothetical protein